MITSSTYCIHVRDGTLTSWFKMRRDVLPRHILVLAGSSIQCITQTARACIVVDQCKFPQVLIRGGTAGWTSSNVFHKLASLFTVSQHCMSKHTNAVIGAFQI